MVWESVHIKKKKKRVYVKKNYKKIGLKKDNNMDANMVQLERSNSKCYASNFRYI